MQQGRLDRGDGTHLAWAARAGRGPTLVFLPGLRSDMEGTKALALDEWCASQHRALLRLDYSGHGSSDGRFEDGTIGRWIADALCVIDARTSGKLLLIGSSMGGWIMLHVALARAARIAGLVGIAAAPDFTERLMWQALSPPERDHLRQAGKLLVPSPYAEPLPITEALIVEGRHHLLLDRPIPITAPVRLLHGQDDGDVPWEMALELAGRIAGADVRTILVKDGDHRLSRPADIELLRATIAGLLGEDGV